MFITLSTDFSHFFSENFSTCCVPGLAGGFRDERTGGFLELTVYLEDKQ